MKAILFDLDETLHDKTSTLRLMAARQFAEFSLADTGVDAEAWASNYLQQHKTLVPKHRAFDNLRKVFSLNGTTTAQLLEDYNHTCGNHAQAFPGLHQLLTACANQGLALACITNGRDQHQRSKLAGLKITDYFDVVVTSGGFGSKKPDLAIFNRCLAQLQTSPGDSIMIGDNYAADMVPALKLGMGTVWKSSKESGQVDYCSNSLVDIRSYLTNTHLTT